VLVVNSAARFVSPPGVGSWVGVYPFNGQTGVPRSFLSDSESPDPVAGADKVGYPISFHVDDSRTLSVSSFTVAPVSGGVAQAPLPNPTLLTSATDPNNETPASAAAIIPAAPLEYDTEYEVSFSGTANGNTPIAMTWRFRTAPLLPITFSPSQPYIGNNSSIDIEVSGGSGAYTGFTISYTGSAPATVASIGPHTLRVTTASAIGTTTVTVTDDEGQAGEVAITAQPTADSTPDAFSFPPVNSAALSPVVTSATITVSACDGEGNCSAQSAVASATTLDNAPPSVPAGLSATAVSASQINLAWSATLHNVGVTAYRVLRGGVFRATVSAPSTSFSDSGLKPSTSYNYTLAACDAAGHCSVPSGAASTATPAPGQYAYSAVLADGFNLVGNAFNAVLDVAAIFGNQDVPTGLTSGILSIWKWNAVDLRWAFYSPQLTDAANAVYAAAHNYEVLATIGPGTGYWVNALVPITLPMQSGAGLSYNPFNFAALPSGFNLIASATDATPSEFNLNVNQTPPAPGVVPTNNFVSLWTWDAVARSWYFYAPELESVGGLPAVKAYADSHGYRHFQDYGKTIGFGAGFWVNKQ
jgi:hypothetical protein